MTAIGAALHTALEAGQRRCERPPLAEPAGGGLVGEVLPLPRDGELEHHRSQRGEDDRRQRPDDAERALVVVATEQPGELQEVRDRGDGRADHRCDRGDEDVAVLDVRELVREHGAHLVPRKRLDEALGNGHRCVTWAAACGERIWLLGRDQIEPRQRQPRALAERTDVLVHCRQLIVGQRPGTAQLQRELVRPPVHGEVHPDRQDEEEEEPAGPADQGADGDEEGAEPREQDPGTDTRGHEGVESPFRVTMSCHPEVSPAHIVGRRIRAVGPC